jgi:hypothetical protein
LSLILKRREIPIALTAFFALYMMIAYHLNLPWLSEQSQMTIDIQTFSQILGVMALGLGYIAIAKLHIGYISKRVRHPQHWVWSVWLLIVLAATTIVGLPWGSFGMRSSQMTYMYQSILLPMRGAMYAIVAFYIASAAYRVFLARNREAAVMLGCSFVIMLTNAPIGELLGTWIGDLGSWLLKVPCMAGERALAICAGFGSIVLAWRMITGRETGYLRGSEGGRE